MDTSKNKHKAAGFKVPKNYFEDFHVAFPDKSFTEEQVLHESLNSGEAYKTPGYKTPALYFENLSIDLPDTNKKSVVLFSVRKTLPYVAVAAALTIIFLINSNWFSKVDYTSQIDPLALESYLEKSLLESDFNEDLESTFPDVNRSMESTSISEQTILNYVDKNQEFLSYLEP
ncbi:hypothetical protein [Mesonia sp. HuA40]|uniref:hypothetical protein n=1 Tax=Mesonia sp. HuA40 TaxID=2602761 RepID=UPI0011CA431E|nr:hypothetical protein [Mesonia sp. HuA40]TXK70212.1 hypothetical protein FT993_12035 [Mesonia sp. HuA40]